MISSVGSSSFSQYLPQINTKLTDDQKTTLQSILAKYDSSTITEDGMKSLMDEIKAAGIKPGKDLKDTVESAGFKMKPPPPPKTGQSSSTDETESTSYLEQLIQELLDSIKSGTSSVSSTSSTQYSAKSSFNAKLTDDQKTTLQSILSKYDSSTITEDGMKSMLDEIKSAGITPSKDLKDTVEAAGFNLKPPPQGAKPEANSSTDETTSTSYLEQVLQNILDNIKLGKSSETDLNTLVKNLQDAGTLSQGLFIDSKA